MKRRYFVSFFVLLSLAAFASAAAGQEWIQLHPEGTPPTPRSCHTTVYDWKSNRLIVFGGLRSTNVDDPNQYLNDLWVLTNANGVGGTPEWLELHPIGSLPDRRAQHTAVYDSSSSRMVIFGGYNPAEFNDVWVLANANGQTGVPEWAKLEPIGPLPQARASLENAVYDPTQNRMILFGGAHWGCGWGCNMNDTWVLSGANGMGTAAWTQLNPVGTIPSIRRHVQAIYDVSTNRMTIFAGLGESPPMERNETWVLENANGFGAPIWSQLPPPSKPPGWRASPYGGYDPMTNRMVSFGAVDWVYTGAGFIDVWILRNANGIGGIPSWVELLPTNNPPPRRWLSKGVYDAVSNRLILFGGCLTGENSGCTGTMLNDVWVLTNANGITNVAIDIKPGSYPNSINLGANGVVPVAILTTPDFDASTVDGLSLALSGASVKLRGKSQEVGALEDVDDDGDLDLVVQFYINELELTEGATEAVLAGKTKSGAEIMGKDSVRIVPE
jgi:hypothetical protein